MRRKIIYKWMKEGNGRISPLRRQEELPEAKKRIEKSHT